MRKILAVLLAMIFVVGMTPTVVAADTAKLITVSDAFLLEDRYGKVSTKEPTDYIAGETLYYEVSAVNSTIPLVLADLKGYGANWRINDGSVRIRSTTFVTKQNDAGEERVYLAVKLKDTFQNSGNSIVDAEISITAKEGYGVAGKARVAADTDISLSGNVLYGVADDVSSGPYSVNESIFNFAEDADNVTLCFDRNIEVSGNMRGEKDLFLRLSTSNEGLQSKYPNAQLRLFDGNRKTFQHPVTVKMPITAIEGKNGKPAAPYLYELCDGEFSEAENATYNLADEMFIITTKVLGNYIVLDEALDTIISDKELAAPDAEKPEQWALSNGVEENPQTGRVAPAGKSGKVSCKTLTTCHEHDAWMKDGGDAHATRG